MSTLLVLSGLQDKRALQEHALTLFRPGFFYCLKVQGGVFKDPLWSQEPLKLAQ